MRAYHALQTGQHLPMLTLGIDFLSNPPPESVIFENTKVVVCLASYPITKGHTIVIWKEKVSDLHLLNRSDYLTLMETVDKVRNALLKVFKIEKIYLIYMDEAKQVHWHLIPRYNQKGFNLLVHEPKITTDFSLIPKIRAALNI
jgi:diadenosine tetraphosphate (Ap4A) HIT family hydrolase